MSVRTDHSTVSASVLYERLHTPVRTPCRTRSFGGPQAQNRCVCRAVRVCAFVGFVCGMVCGVPVPECGNGKSIGYRRRPPFRLASLPGAAARRARHSTRRDAGAGSPGCGEKKNFKCPERGLTRTSTPSEATRLNERARDLAGPSRSNHHTPTPGPALSRAPVTF